MERFCFPTDLIFVKNPSEAAALTAGTSAPVGGRDPVGWDPLGSGRHAGPPRILHGCALYEHLLYATPPGGPMPPLALAPRPQDTQGTTLFSQTCWRVALWGPVSLTPTPVLSSPVSLPNVPHVSVDFALGLRYHTPILRLEMRSRPF